MDIVSLITSLISGAVGGNSAESWMGGSSALTNSLTSQLGVTSEQASAGSGAC